MTDKLYVNRVGGVIVHLKDGSAKHLPYASPVDVSELADGVDPAQFSDELARSGPTIDDPVRAANLRAALDGAGGGGSSSQVPSNYGSLDTDDAAMLVASISEPRAQASILVFEALNSGNRQKVRDAASELARQIADELLASETVSALESGDGDEPVASSPDPLGPNANVGKSLPPIQDAEPETPEPASTGDEGEGQTEPTGDGEEPAQEPTGEAPQEPEATEPGPDAETPAPDAPSEEQAPAAEEPPAEEPAKKSGVRGKKN